MQDHNTPTRRVVVDGIEEYGTEPDFQEAFGQLLMQNIQRSRVYSGQLSSKNKSVEKLYQALGKYQKDVGSSFSFRHNRMQDNLKKGVNDYSGRSLFNREFLGQKMQYNDRDFGTMTMRDFIQSRGINEKDIQTMFGVNNSEFQGMLNSKVYDVVKRGTPNSCKAKEGLKECRKMVESDMRSFNSRLEQVCRNRYSLHSVSGE